MNLVHLLPVGNIHQPLLENLRSDLPKTLRVECEIHPLRLDPAPSYHAERQQFHSSELLQRMHQVVRARDWRLLDLRHCEDYRCAMASSHAVEWIDLRESSWCEACRAKAEAVLSAESVTTERRI